VAAKATGAIKNKKAKVTEGPHPKGQRVMVLKDGRKARFEWRERP